jgi:mannose-6-phosphate isomerase-like protein (cupin superfamily)
MTGVTLEKIPHSHDDERRTLIPAFNTDMEGFSEAKQLKLALLKKDSVLGKHWHDYAELFTVYGGNAVFVLAPRDGGEPEEFLLQPGWRLLIPARIWHEARVEGGTLLIGLTEEKYISPDFNDHK